MNTSEIREALVKMGFGIAHEIHGVPIKCYRITHSLLPGLTLKVEADPHGVCKAYNWLKEQVYHKQSHIDEAREKSLTALREMLKRDDV